MANTTTATSGLAVKPPRDRAAAHPAGLLVVAFRLNFLVTPANPGPRREPEETAPDDEADAEGGGRLTDCPGDLADAVKGGGAAALKGVSKSPACLYRWGARGMGARAMARLLLFNKPFGVLSQFTDAGTATARPTLSGFIALRGVYPAGRLDRDSEGLLLLTDDGQLQARIADPRFKMPKTYLAQVEGEAGEAQLARLCQGVRLNDGPTLPAAAERIAPPPLWPRDPPVRFRKSVPDSWISLTIREGRNRQVRRMTATVGLPTLRLVRWRIGEWTLDGLASGEWREVPMP